MNMVNLFLILKQKTMAKKTVKKAATKKVKKKVAINYEKIQDKLIGIGGDIDQIILPNYFAEGCSKSTMIKGVKEYRSLAKDLLRKADAWEKLINNK